MAVRVAVDEAVGVLVAVVVGVEVGPVGVGVGEQAVELFNISMAVISALSTVEVSTISINPVVTGTTKVRS